MAQLGFNAASVDMSGSSRELLPKGRYIVVCEKSDVKPNKKGTGHILSLTFVVAEGDHKKRKIFEHINIQNENQVAQRIGQQQLAAFCHAVGITQLDNSFQLHGIPVEVEVDIKEAKDGWDAKNVIKGYLKKAEITSGINLSAPAPTPGMPPIMRPTTAYQPASVTDMDDDIPF